MDTLRHRTRQTDKADRDSDFFLLPVSIPIITLKDNNWRKEEEGGKKQNNTKR